MQRNFNRKKELDVIDSLIKSYIHCDMTGMKRLNQIVSSGKRIRSILYLFYWEKCKSNPLKYCIPAILELIHYATLLHDDVIDNNNMRRGKSSLNTTNGNKMSIIIGDTLLVQMIDKLLHIFNDNVLLRNFCLRELRAIAYGAYLERALTIKSTLNECIRVAWLKTSSLFKLSCFLGKFISTHDFEKSKTSAIVGICYGILYQFQNDIDSYSFEFYEDSEDFMQKNITMPLLIARDYMNYDVTKFLKSDEFTFCELKEIIHTPEFQVYVRKILAKYLEKVSELPEFLHPMPLYRC